MTVGKTTPYLQGLSHRQELPALQCSPDDLNDSRRQVGDVSQGLMLNFATLAIATTQKVGLVESAFIAPLSSGYMNCSVSLCHIAINIILVEYVKRKMHDISGYTLHNKKERNRNILMQLQLSLPSNTGGTSG